MLDTWFFKDPVLRALDQREMGGEGKEEQGFGISEMSIISQKAWHNEAGVLWFSDCSWLPPLQQQSVE